MPYNYFTPGGRLQNCRISKFSNQNQNSGNNNENNNFNYNCTQEFYGPSYDNNTRMNISTTFQNAQYLSQNGVPGKIIVFGDTNAVVGYLGKTHGQNGGSGAPLRNKF